MRHVNVLPLMMSAKNGNRGGKFYYYHFMLRMDYDLRQILSAKKVNISTEITKETVQYLKEHLLMWSIHWRKHSKH